MPSIMIHINIRYLAFPRFQCNEEIEFYRCSPLTSGRKKRNVLFSRILYLYLYGECQNPICTMEFPENESK